MDENPYKAPAWEEPAGDERQRRDWLVFDIILAIGIGAVILAAAVALAT
jgi:hypothetical protein